jgi:hypothetical protein
MPSRDRRTRDVIPRLAFGELLLGGFGEFVADPRYPEGVEGCPELVGVAALEPEVGPDAVTATVCVEDSRLAAELGELAGFGALVRGFVALHIARDL